MESALQLQNLSVGYHIGAAAKVLCANACAEAKKAELVALVGRNGRGKSTLLRTIIGLQKALSGKVFIFEKAQHSYHVKELATLMSYVSTDNVKVGYLKVFDLVSLGRYPYTSWFGTLSTNDKEIVMHSLQLVGMQDFAERNTNSLSDGERQRVMIARALAQDTPIVVLDEPTAFLDLPNRYEVVFLLQRLAREQRKTILYSTHDWSLAVKTSDSMWVMDSDSFWEGAPADLLQQGVFDKLLIDTNLRLDAKTAEVQQK
ncbi:MAG: ABC transporter ATP-binding protein [Prevotellaceae bacterium]|jgi:iron complex transport system ATP-binding protein|nr:ABC transporter ATP-binding protein [Prevotellaceae bacterium]